MSYTQQAVAGGPRAGLWQRFCAVLIDYFLVVAFSAGLILAFTNGGYLVSLFLHPAYFTYCEGRPAGQTIGKRLLGIRVIDSANGGPIGYRRAFVRYVGRLVSAFFFYAGYLWMLWDPEKQCWHDKFARDVVVPTTAYPPPAWP
jgi:uncharacterized RDD family membrane protein YckC